MVRVQNPSIMTVFTNQGVNLGFASRRLCCGDVLTPLDLGQRYQLLSIMYAQQRGEDHELAKVCQSSERRFWHCLLHLSSLRCY